MPRDRNPGRASPDSSLGDYTPDSRSPVRSYSPSRSRSRSRSRRERRGSEYETPVRSRSQSNRRGRRDSSASSDSSVRSGASRGHGSHGGKARLASKLKDKTTTTSGLKTSLVFLGSIAAATYAAHKFWPKGITYGEREAWEEEHEVVKKKAKRALERGEDPRSHHGGGPSRHGPPVDDDGGGDRRRPIAYDRPRSSLARYETDEVALRRRDNDDRLAVRDDAPFVRRAASLHRGHSDGVTTMSVASGSRAGDARRAQYVDENQTVRRDDPRAHAAWDRRDEGLDEDRRYADYGRPAPRYVEREVPRRRSSFDEPPDGRRGERVVYM